MRHPRSAYRLAPPISPDLSHLSSHSRARLSPSFNSGGSSTHKPSSRFSTVYFSVLCSLLMIPMLLGCDDDPKSNPEMMMIGGDLASMGGQGGAASAGEMGREPGGQDGGEIPGGMGEGGASVAGMMGSRQQIESIEASKTLQLTGLTRPVEVLFTEGNIPHIYAENTLDLGRTLGYILAKDRFFTMDLIRRLGQGTLGEIFGELALETDQESRGIGMHIVAERLHENTSPQVAEYLEAICSGINDYIDSVRDGVDPPPSEYMLAGPLFGMTPVELMAPWERIHLSTMAAVILYQTNFETGDVSATDRYRQLADIYGEDSTRREAFILDVALNQKPTFPAYSATPSPQWGEGAPWSLNGMSDEGSGGAQAGAEEMGGGTPMAGMDTKSSQNDPPYSAEGQDPSLHHIHSPPQLLTHRLTERLRGLEGWFGKDPNEGFGSNAWAAGQGATLGGAVVAGDGHLQLSIPSLMYQMGLDTSELGGGEIHQAGLLIAGIPLMAVGTNGRVAWSQVNPVVDITDWYTEELQLDESGHPTDSMFMGEWRPLVTREEQLELADRPVLGTAARTVTWTLFATFDGRRIAEIEGREVSETEALAEGEARVNLQGTWIVPQDLNEDGVISAISFDYGAFDATGFIDGLFEIGLAQDLDEFQTQTKRFVGGGLFSAAGDLNGNVLFTSYQAVPCRGYLDRDASGAWASGSSPMALLDGTQIGGFTLPTDSLGYVDEGDSDDPYRCVIPFDQMPQSLNPATGYVATANNDPLGFADDGRVDNDAWYIGGPWSVFRADTIMRSLDRAVEMGPIIEETMQEIQANDVSRLGELLTPYLIEAMSHAEMWGEDIEGLSQTQTRAVYIWASELERFSAVRERLSGWAERGFHAQSGVETFYNEVDDIEREDAVATMIFNAYIRKFLPLVWGDEPQGAIPHNGSRIVIYALDRILKGRGANNPLNLASWDEGRQESLFFDDLRTEDLVEGSDELMLKALYEALTDLTEPPSATAEGGFGTPEMSEWLWGLRHQARFDSLLGPFLGTDGPTALLLNQFSITTAKLPLAPMIPEGDPRAELTHFPRPGDQWGVDAGNPGLGGDRYTHKNGPVMRMVITLKEGEPVTGVNIVPGGQSGITSSPHFFDQLPLWLANETYPLRFHLSQVIEGAETRWRFEP
jgi:penicillin G amidase